MDQILAAAQNVGVAHISHIISDVIPRLQQRYIERYGTEEVSQDIIEERMHEMTRSVDVD